MAKQTNDYQPTGFRIAAILLEAADTTVAKTLIAADADDTTINQLSIRNVGAASALVEIILHDGTNSYVLETADVPAYAGSNGVTPAFDVMALENIYNANLLLAAGWSIRLRAKVTVTGTLTAIAIATDY
jgi:hypothetical protein